MIQHFGPDLILLEKIAAGGMAEVFLAQFRSYGGFQREVAVKRMLPHLSADPNLRLMFEREVSIWSRLQHPNIATVYRSGLIDTYLYLVMEYINGKNLLEIQRQFFERKLIPPQAFSLYVVSEAACGLGYAHNLKDEISGKPLNLIHRDCSPHNIMIGFNGQVKVVDFGIARAADQMDLTRTGDLKGKLFYMAPELIMGKRADARVDVFGLGMVLYELLTQHRPFRADHTLAGIRKIQEFKIPSFSELGVVIDPELERIVFRALAREPDERYSTAEEFYSELTRYSSDLTVDCIADSCSEFLSRHFSVEIAERREWLKRLGRAVDDYLASLGAMEERLAADDGESSVMFLDTMQGSGPTEHQPPLPTAEAVIAAAAQAKSRRIWPVVVLGFILSWVVGISIFFWLQQAAPKLAIESIPGAVAWLRADQLNLSHGDRVERWSGSVAGVGASQAVPARQPQMKRLPGRWQAAVAFDGLGQFLTADSIAGVLGGVSELTVAVVAQHGGIVGKRMYLWSLQGQRPQLGMIGQLGFTDRRQIIASAPNLRLGNGEPASHVIHEIGELSSYVYTLNGTRLRCFRNGELVIDKPLSPGRKRMAQLFAIGQRWNPAGPSDFFMGYLAEMLVFKRSLLAEEREEIEKYFAAKYKLKISTRQPHDTLHPLRHSVTTSSSY